MKQKFGIILAAGKGTRMKSSLYKVMHPVCGKPMVEHVVDQVEKTGATEIVAIVGHGAEMVQNHLGDRVSYAVQAEQLGTGHAVLQAESLLKGKEGTTIVICGDTPLLTSETLSALMEEHERTGAKATILTAIAEDPTGYGRVIRDADGSVLKNVEQKDATPEEQQVKEINTGTYCFDNVALFSALHEVGNDNAQGEHMRNVVTLIDPEATHIESTVQIGADTVIEPGVVLKGKTVIGSNCFIGAHSVVRDSVLEDGVRLVAANIEESHMKRGSNAGPFAHLRPNSVLGERVHVGNFVEVKNSTLGADTKVGHLTYIGDADLGEDINVGCGTVFVNYDGKNKHRATIGSHVFIGCNANIVAPVTVGDDVFIAAGSTITEDVPAGALAIARSRQVNKEDYASKLPSAQKD